MFYLITKPDCIYCDWAKGLIRGEGEDVMSFSYQEHPMLTKLMFKAGLKTVPQIWREGEYIGGYDDLVEWFAKQESE